MYVWSNINAIAKVLTARLIKLDCIKQKVEQHDETMPEHLEKLRTDISAALDRAGVLADPAKSGSAMTHDFHSMLSERIQKMIPGGSENAVIRGFTSAALKDSIDEADKAHDTEGKIVFPQERLVASLVKELNLSPEELNQLLDSAGGSDAKSKELKAFVLSALKEGKVELKK